jgi:hypothetical protein
MKPKRRQFPALASTAGAWFPFLKAGARLNQESSSPQGNFARATGTAPMQLFDGTSLTGWRMQGPAQWRVDSGELLGSCEASGVGGWLRSAASRTLC